MLVSNLKKNYLTILLSVIVLLLNACSSVPSGKNDIRGVCRSCKPYNIRGSWYYPQLNYHYNEKGVASWYGPGFHGKSKATGERYDQNGISAAHKTLPLPTIARVTNLENGKSIELIIDDRGPFIDNREIDLSVGAAKALGSYSKGLAKVRVEALPEKSDAFSRHLYKLGGRTGRDPRGRTWAQIYAQDIKKSKESYSPFSSLDKAKSLKRSLNALEKTTIYEKKSQPGVYFVQSGPYTSKSMAQSALIRLQNQGHQRAKIIQRL
jgi:rare lipoprotein A